MATSSRARPANSSGGRPSKWRVASSGTVDEQVDGVPAPVAGCARDAQGGVVGPDGAVVVAERVVRRHRPGQGAQTPAGPQVRVDETFDVSARLFLVGDAGPQRVPGIRCEGVDGSPVRVQSQDEVAARVPEPLVEPVLERLRARTQVGGLVADVHNGGQLRRALQGGVHVALHLHEGQGRGWQRAVRPGDAVPGVLPALVGEPSRVPTAVVDEPVAIGVAGSGQPVDGAAQRRGQAAERVLVIARHRQASAARPTNSGVASTVP